MKLLQIERLTLDLLHQTAPVYLNINRTSVEKDLFCSAFQNKRLLHNKSQLSTNQLLNKSQKEREKKV